MATWTNQSSNSASWTNWVKSGDILYAVTSALDNILVGASEDETLIFQDAVTWTNQSRS